VNLPALLLVGHGFRDEEGAEAFRSLVDRLAKRLPGTPVTGSVAGPPGPPPADAVAELAASGTTDVTAVALTLAPSGDGHGAGTARDEIATAVAAATQDLPDVTVTLAGPLSGHPRLLALLEARVDAALDSAGRGRTPGDRAATTVLLVGEGSPDPATNAELARTARLLWEGRGLAGVETAFVSVAAPDVPAGLDRCARLGARRIVLVPYVLFGAAAAGRARLQAEGWAEAHPGIEVRHAEPLGPDEDLAEVVAACWEQAAPPAAAPSGPASSGPAPSGSTD
jgi:sirohydrochlorin cobaltochelatase